MAGPTADPVPGGIDERSAPRTGGDQRDRRRALARLAGIVVVVGLVVAFVVENTNPVTVHLWVVDRRLALVWVIAGCVVAGLAVGYWVGWQGHRRALERRARGSRRRWGRGSGAATGLGR
jgi:uncharacterized integral membrane protein